MGARRISAAERRYRKWESRRVYVLWALWTERFKIGIAASPRRIHDIQACSPVELVLVGMRPATIRDEFELHTALRRYRVHGEWFDLPEEELWRLIEWLGPMVAKFSPIKGGSRAA